MKNKIPVKIVRITKSKFAVFHGYLTPEKIYLYSIASGQSFTRKQLLKWMAGRFNEKKIEKSMAKVDSLHVHYGVVI